MSEDNLYVDVPKQKKEDEKAVLCAAGFFFVATLGFFALLVAKISAGVPLL